MGVELLGLSEGTYFGEMQTFVDMKDIMLGFWKSMSFGILVAHKSAPADLSTSRVTASRLVTTRRSPSMVGTTGSLSAHQQRRRFFGRGPRGLPDWAFLNRLCTDGLLRPTS